MTKTVADVLALLPEVKMVDFRFTDLPGVWQHFTVPARELTAEIFEDGVGFDGSSIRGFKEIHESDMLLMLDPSTAFIDPIFEVPTLAIICDVYDPITREPYARDPRYIAGARRRLSAADRHRRHQLLGAGSRVLHVQRCALRRRHQRGLLPHRQR